MKLRITIDDKAYEAEIEVLEDERHEPSVANSARTARQHAGGALPATPQPPVAAEGDSSNDKVCRSSVMGIVVNVLAAVGQTVAVDEPLVVLEAMKMESNVLSPLAGRVKAIRVAAGESVKKGQVLVEFE